jgi:hypothetical protein
LLLSAFERLVRVLEILLRALTFAVCSLQILLRALMVGVGALQVVLDLLALGLRPLEFFLGPLAFRVRTLQLVVRRLPIHVCALAVRLCAFDVGLRSLELGLRALAFRVRTFEIRLRASALRHHGFVDFPARLRCRLRCCVLGFRSRPRDRFGQGALHFRASRAHFGLEPRPPLCVDVVELCGPALFRICVGALTCFLQRLVVRIGEVAELRLEFGLQLRPDAVNHAANRFLGHKVRIIRSGIRQVKHRKRHKPKPESNLTAVARGTYNGGSQLFVSSGLSALPAIPDTALRGRPRFDGDTVS